MTSTQAPEAARTVGDADRHPLVARTREYAEQVLRPQALLTDRAGVDEARIQELADLGLLGNLAAQSPSVDRDVDRRLQEVLAGACFNTFLVWAQHAPLIGLIETARKAGHAHTDLTRRALDGRILLGAGISDARRFPRHHVEATPTSTGWQLRGTLSWVSGWGLNSALTVAAVHSPSQTVVTALVRVGERTRATPLDLSVVAGSRTERVFLDDVEVPHPDVLRTESLATWRRKDLGASSDARPHQFGLAETVLTELETNDHPEARAVATTWRPRIARARQQAYALSDEAQLSGDGRHRLSERIALKVSTNDALGILTRALVVARAGHGVTGDDTAQLHARSALFVLIQGQNSDVRTAALTAFAR